MSLYDDEKSSTLSINNVNIDNLQAVTIDNQIISAIDNDATIAGTLFEWIKWATHNGYFTTLIEDRAAPVGGGRLAISDLAQIPFITKQLDDPRSFENPCPDTLTRVAAYTIKQVKKTVATPPHKDVAVTKVPDELSRAIIVAPHAVRQEDARLLKSLTLSFNKISSFEELVEAAAGSGLKLLSELRARAAAAELDEHGIVHAAYYKIIQDGVPGELTLAAYEHFKQIYKTAKRNVSADSRMPVPAEIQMVSTIAMSDKSIKPLWEMAYKSEKPTTMDAASKILTTILRSRLRSEQLEKVKTGAVGSGLSLYSDVCSPSDDPAPASEHERIMSALAAGGLPPSFLAALKPEHLNALATTLGAAPADPNKTHASRPGDGTKVEIPRGADNKPLRWVPGMTLCRCGVDGGKHLFKDCPAAAAKKAKKAKDDAKKAKRALAAAQEAAADGAQDGVIDPDLRAALIGVLSKIGGAK